MEKRGSYGKPKNDMSKAKQCDIKREAIKCILNDFLDGATHSTVVDKLANDYYGIGFQYTRYSAKKLIEEARKMMKKDFNNEVAGMKERIFNMILDVYTDSKEAGNHHASLKALEMINRMFGLNEPDKQEVTFKNVSVDFGFSD